MNKDFHTVMECAIYLGESYRWVLNKIHNDPRFPKRQIGNRWVIPNKALGLWIADTGFVRKGC